jgi:hypothetical protein
MALPDLPVRPSSASLSARDGQERARSQADALHLPFEPLHDGPDNPGLWSEAPLELLVRFSCVPVRRDGGRLVLAFGGLEDLPNGDEGQLTDFAVMFDYGVSFEFHIDSLDIHSTKPMRVRYKAVGMNLHFPLSEDPNAPGVVYQPVFDTSRGYEVELSDPALFELPSPLGDLLEITAARIVRPKPGRHAERVLTDAEVWDLRVATLDGVGDGDGIGQQEPDRGDGKRRRDGTEHAENAEAESSESHG